LIFSILLIANCGKSSDEPAYEYTLEGTVTLGDQPAEGVSVEAGYKDLSNRSIDYYDIFDSRTDNSGEYKFVLTKPSNKGFFFRARVKHPKSGSWSEWKVSVGAVPGISVWLNFNLE